MNVPDQARVGKDQVGKVYESVKETINHNSRALVKTNDKEL